MLLDTAEYLSKTDFLKKYDNGEGWDWSIDLGGDWEGDWGFGPNSKDNNKIFPAEAENAGGIDSLVSDFKQLSEDDQRSVLKYFKGGLSEKILGKIESPGAEQTSYADFKEKFDNGETANDSEADDWYGNSEIIAGGAYLALRRDLAKLPFFARMFVKHRATKEVKDNLNKNSAELFWKSYDGNSDWKISKQEIRYIGWENFKLDILELSKPAAIDVFDRLLNAPPPDAMAVIKENFPAYAGPYNLRQFPSAQDAPYRDASEAMKVVDAVSGRQNTEITPETIPPFGYPLTSDHKDRFHAALYSHINPPPSSGYRVKFSDLSSIMERAKNSDNTACVSKLREALRNEDASRYVGSAQSVLKGHARLMDSKYSNAGEERTITLREDMHSKKFIRAASKLNGVSVSEDAIEVSKETTGDAEPKVDSVKRYRVSLPYKRADLYFALCEDIGWFFDRNCIPMKMSKIFPRYEIDARNERITENWLNEDRLQTDMLLGHDLKVAIRRSDELDEMLMSGYYYVEPIIDLWTQWRIMEERRVFP